MALIDVSEEPQSLHARVMGLNARFADATPHDILAGAISEVFEGEIAAVTSFGAESAMLLHMIAQVDRSLPIYFINTGKHFGETLRYQLALTTQFALSGIRVVTPDFDKLSRHDADGLLFSRDPDRCCFLRKTEPLNRALAPYSAWITGRKRYQTVERSSLDVFEVAEGRVKVNPVAAWGMEEVAAYMERHQLPQHPLVAQGYRSIGCMPCTTRTAPGEDPRSGRWRGTEKTECGIHLPGFEQDGSSI